MKIKEILFAFIEIWEEENLISQAWFLDFAALLIWNYYIISLQTNKQTINHQPIEVKASFKSKIKLNHDVSESCYPPPDLKWAY